VQRVDVVVVGAGAMGSSAAWWLARRGRSVVLVEQFEQGHARGSSHGGTRIFRFAYPDPVYVRMAQAALPLWRELEDDTGRVLLETTGAVDHGDPVAIDAVAAALDACDAAHQLLAPDAAAERWPHMRFDRSVLFHPDGGRCLADATVAALQERAAAHGADVRFATGPASVVPKADEAVVRAGDGEWVAPAVVVTAGAWLPAVAGALVVLPPLVVTHEQVQHFVPRGDADGSAWPSFIHHRRPWVYGLFTPGEGMKVAEHHVGPEIDPDTRDQRIDDAATGAAARYVEQWFPGLDPTPVHAARCLYTTTPDENFVIDRVGPLVIGSPCSGHGFKFTPLIGRLLADLADGRSPSAIGLDARFALRRAGNAEGT
jgi:sarcosine oxidase